MKFKAAKQVFAAVLTGAMIMGSVGMTTVSADDSIELSFWALQTRQDALEALTEEFNEANPNIHVTVSYYSTDGIKDACKTAAQSGSMPSMWFNWGGALGQYYVDNGVTKDMTAYGEEHGWTDKFNAGAMSLCTLSDQLAGYPTSYNVLGIYYRKDIFEQNGLEVPTTIEEFEAVCDTLKAAGITPMNAAGLYGWHVMRWVEQFVELKAGAEAHDELQALTADWNTESVVEAFQMYKDYAENGYFPEGFISANPDDCIMTFGMGAAAMDIQGQWYDGQINSNGIDMNNVSWFAFPNGTGRMSAFAEMTQFNSDLTDDELDAAVAYMDYIYSEEQATRFPDAYNLPLPIEGASMPEGQPNVPELLAASAENGTFTITDQAFPAEVADVLFQCQEAIAGGSMTPEEAAASIETAIEAYKAK
jgi:raffinose/stachyose/melibiose transport system substrate-binding protein